MERINKLGTETTTASLNQKSNILEKINHDGHKYEVGLPWKQLEARVEEL